MESELKTEFLKDSLNNDKINKNISICFKEEEIKNNSFVDEINYEKNLKMSERSFEDKVKIELNDNEEQSKKLNEEINDKKINNKRVNNLLDDIYGSLSNINEVNNKVKDILSKRKKINSVNSFRNGIKEQKDIVIKNKKKSLTINKNKTNYNIKTNIIPDEFSIIKKANINTKNISDNVNETTKNETDLMNVKSKKHVIYTFNQLNNNSNSKENQINQIITTNKETLYYKVNTKSKDNLLEKKFKNNINLKFYKYDDLINEDNITKLNEKNEEISSINNNLGFYDEEFENEKIIRYMKIKLNNEEKKLRVLEEQKNKLLNEEKIRRKILMEKIKKKNRLKKQNLINEYKNKLSLIQKLQTNNINEIRKLEIKKKIDEENIIKVEKMCSNININDSFSTKSRTDKRKKGNSLTKTRLENSSDRSDYLISENNPQQKFINKKYETKYQIFSKNNIVKTNEKKKKKNNFYNTESEEALTEEFQFNNSINELASTCDNAEENESFSNSQETKNSSLKKKLNFDNSAKSIKIKKGNINPYNYLYNYYQKINQSNNRKNYKDENKNIYNYLNRNNKNRKYHSETRQYNKSSNNIKANTDSRRKSKINLTPNQDVISFIQTRVNKYDHSSDKSSNISKRHSQITAYPSYLKYNLNCKYNYKYSAISASNTRGFNDFARKNSQRSGRNKQKKIKELNFKYIFYNHN